MSGKSRLQKITGIKTRLAGRREEERNNRRRRRDRNRRNGGREDLGKDRNRGRMEGGGRGKRVRREGWIGEG